LHSCLHFCKIRQDMIYRSLFDKSIPSACTEKRDDVSMRPLAAG
jgi:hypothetical protein